MTRTDARPAPARRAGGLGLRPAAMISALALALGGAPAAANANGPFSQVPAPRPAKAGAVLAPDIDVDAYRR